jgi:hypothetical protein
MTTDPNIEDTNPDAIITKSQAESFSKIKGTLASMGFDVESTSDVDVVAMLTYRPSIQPSTRSSRNWMRT